MEIKMICMDLDGTTLLDDHESFSPRLIEALRKAHERGVLIVPATGRPFYALPPAVLGHPEWESWGILANGEEIRDLRTGEKLRELLVPNDAAEALLDYAEKWDLGIEFYMGGRIYLTEETYMKEKACPELEFHISEVIDRDATIISDMRHLLSSADGLERIQLMCVPSWLRAVIFGEMVPYRLSALTSWMGQRHMEFTHHDAHKGKGIETLCSMIGMDMENVMAMGDEDNDVSMLRMAGLGVAMGNGPDYVHFAADVVTGSNLDDGAAEAIEKYVLGI